MCPIEVHIDVITEWQPPNTNILTIGKQCVPTKRFNIFRRLPWFKTGVNRARKSTKIFRLFLTSMTKSRLGSLRNALLKPLDKTSQGFDELFEDIFRIY